MSEHNPIMKQLQNLDIRVLAVVVSVLFSWVVIAGQAVLNDDAYSYLKAAELYASQGLGATLGAYGWYGYSVIISLVDSILPTSLVNSAHIFNTMCFALLVWSFITLVSEFTPSKEARCFAAIVILCFPTINEMRYALVRDFGYWACCLTALVQLTRYSRSGNILHAVGWVLAMGVAVFFRLEGLLLVLLTPFALLAGWRNQPAPGSNLFFKLISILLGCTVLILLVFIAAGINLADIFRFAYRWYLPLLADYPGTLKGAAENTSLSFHISEQIQAFTGKGLIILFLGYLYAVAANLVLALGPLFTVFLFFGVVTRWNATRQTLNVSWLFYLAGSLLALLIFVSIMQFLTTRYAVMAALLLLALMPLQLDSLYIAARNSGKKHVFHGVFAAMVFYFVIDSLFSFGYSKEYFSEAIDWSHENLGENELILTNSAAIAYHSGRVTEYDDVPMDVATMLDSLGQYQYFFVALAHDDIEARNILDNHGGLREIIRFTNARDDAVVVYFIPF